MSQKRSPCWIYFDEIATNKRFAQCKLCPLQVDRTQSRTTKLLFDHLRRWHSTEFKLIDPKKKKAANSSMDNNGNNSRPESSNNNGANANAGSSSMNMEDDDDDFEIPKTLRTKNDRQVAFQRTIPNWIESRTIMPFNSKKAMDFHQSIFEMFVLDNRPFTMANDPGFLRLLQKLAPNFEVIGQC